MSKSQLLAVAVAALVLAVPAVALEFDGFTEPYRTISVAGDESGIVAEVLVQEGETVVAGQPLVRLNSDVHMALLAIAEQSMKSEGRVDATAAEMQLRKERLAKLEALREGGYARQEEVDRARAELTVAESNLRSAREDLLVRKLEYDKIRAQVERRTIRAPIAGVVTTLQKDVGEFVAPNSPEVLTLVQLDPLLADFSMMRSDVDGLRLGGKVWVSFPGTKAEAAGVVEYVSPVTDAESGTVLVKVRVDNAEGQIRSGERCLLRLPK